MAETFADGIFEHILLNETVRFSIHISMKFVTRGSNDNKSALFQVMTLCRTGDEPEQMLAQFTDAYVRH